MTLFSICSVTTIATLVRVILAKVKSLGPLKKKKVLGFDFVIASVVTLLLHPIVSRKQERTLAVYLVAGISSVKMHSRSQWELLTVHVFSMHPPAINNS